MMKPDEKLPIKLKLKLNDNVTTKKLKSKKKRERYNNKSENNTMETDARESVICPDGADESGVEVTKDNGKGTKENVQEEEHSNDGDKTAVNHW